MSAWFDELTVSGPRHTETLCSEWCPMLKQILLTCCLSIVTSVAAADDGFLAGASSTSVNPAIGSFIAGDAQNRRFESVHDDLFAKAVVMSDGETALAIVTVDCIGLTSQSIQQIQNLGARRADLPALTPERIIVASTHCHSGPDVVGLWGPDNTQSGVDPDYMKQLIDRTAEQIRRAAATLTPAVIRGAGVHSQVEWIENISEPGDFDRELTVIRIDDHSGRCLATLTNFACHPTILDGVHNVVSSDWIGGHYRGMQDQLPGEHLFLQGAVGGWIQPDKGDRSFELADRYGRELAAEALAALEGAAVESAPQIRFATTAISIPLANQNWIQLARAGILPIEPSDTVVTHVAAFAVGSIGFATHPGETAPAHSRETRKLLKSRTTVVIGLGLDALGYIVKPDYFTSPDRYRHADYLTSMSLGPQAAPLMMQGLREVTSQIGQR